MRFQLIAIFLSSLLSVGPAWAEMQGERITAPDAVLCLSPDNLDAANQPAVAQNQMVLRAMGCLRAESGVRARVMDSTGAVVGEPLQVRFYPAGMSRGIILWGLPSAFVTQDGAQTRSTERT